MWPKNHEKENETWDTTIMRSFKKKFSLILPGNNVKIMQWTEIFFNTSKSQFCLCIDLLAHLLFYFISFTTTMKTIDPEQHRFELHGSTDMQTFL